MSDCERFESTVESYVAGGVDDRALGPLLTHCRSCSDCRQLLELHRDLAALATPVPEPDQADFDAMHARVVGRVAGEATPDTPAAGRRSLVTPWQVTIRPLRVAATVAAALLLFVAGLWIGRVLPAGAPGTAANGNGGVTDRLVRAITNEAASNRVLADVEDSRFIYTSVSFRRANGDRVAIDFDVTTHVQLVEPLQSELVQEVLVQSLLNPSTTGTRLKAMSYAATSMEPKVLQAMTFALQRDESLAVRLQALTILSDRLDDPHVETAVLATLRDDDSMQMRLLALEYLAGHRVNRNLIREAIKKSERPNDRALLVRLTEYEQL